MAEKDKKLTKTAAIANDKKEAIQTAMKNIEKVYGKGAIMRLGDQTNLNVEVIPRFLGAGSGLGDRRCA